MLGLAIILAELSTGIHDLPEDFQGSRGVGTLARKSTVAMIVWLGSWAGLHYSWRDKDIDIEKTFNIGVIAGLLGTVIAGRRLAAGLKPTAAQN